MTEINASNNYLRHALRRSSLSCIILVVICACFIGDVAQATSYDYTKDCT